MSRNKDLDLVHCKKQYFAIYPQVQIWYYKLFQVQQFNIYGNILLFSTEAYHY